MHGHFTALSLGISAHRHGEGRITLTNRIALLVVALLLGLTGIMLASPAGAASTSTSTGTVISEVNSPYGKVLMVGSADIVDTLYQFQSEHPGGVLRDGGNGGRDAAVVRRARDRQDR